MPSLMTIPRELRDQIGTYVLFAQTNEPPALDQSFSQLTQFRTVYNKLSYDPVHRLILKAPEDAVSNAISLLLVNHQLHAETLENINLMRAAAFYSLDVIVLDEILLLTTWTFVPFLTTSVEEVDVNFRISGSFNPEHEGYNGSELYAPFGGYKGFRIGDGAGPAMSMQIYSLLERFIHSGPTMKRPIREHASDEKNNKHVTVKRIKLNVETPPGIDPARFGGPNSHGRFGKMPAKDVLDPYRLADFIEDNILRLLDGRDIDWFSYGMMLFQHVDHVILSRDGIISQSFDVAEMLKNIVADPNTRYLTPERLKNRREATWQVRDERGLKVLTG